MNGNFGCRHITRRPSKMKDQNSVVKSWKVCAEMLFSSQRNLEWVCWNNLMPQYNSSKLCGTMHSRWKNLKQRNCTGWEPLPQEYSLARHVRDDDELHLASSPLVEETAKPRWIDPGVRDDQSKLLANLDRKEKLMILTAVNDKPTIENVESTLGRQHEDKERKYCRFKLANHSTRNHSQAGNQKPTSQAKTS